MPKEQEKINSNQLEKGHSNSTKTKNKEKK